MNLNLPFLKRDERSAENQRLIVRLVRESFGQHKFGYGAAILSMLVVAGMTAASA